VPTASVANLIDASRKRLTPAERRVADAVLSHPQHVAFGTVADLAQRAGTSGATVVRLAAKLGLDGFSALQQAVQDELAHRLRPAAERIREAAPTDVIGRALAVELDNVAGTFQGVDTAAYDAVVAALASLRTEIGVLAGEASRGLGVLLADELGMLRPRVSLLAGNDVGLARCRADLASDAVVIVIDLRRYERWVVGTATSLVAGGARIVALSDSALSPLADLAWQTFVVRAEGAGPFDSHVGTLAMANALVTGVAARLRHSAVRRLDRIEAAWHQSGALLDG
jgi:DNA-binding MurR/RpiR family transcriptional regulator